MSEWEAELHLGNCLEVMGEMESGSVDLVFTSPPYNLGHPKKGSMMKGVTGERLEYSTHKDDMPDKDYEEWQQAVLRECYRLVSDNGAIFYNHKPRIKDGVLNDRRSLIPFPIRQEIVWDVTGKFNFNGTFFVPHTERIFIIAKGKWRVNKECVTYGDVWRIPPERTDKHPATFPTELARRVVLSASKEGDTVLDPFMGSGRVGKVCKQTNRKFRGIEIDPTYFAAARELIDSAALSSMPSNTGSKG